MRKEYDVLAKEARREGMIGVAGGPLVTMFIVMTAFIFLFRYRRKNGTSSTLPVSQWFFVCLSLYCVRNIYGLLIAAISFSISRYKNIHGDEFELADGFGWNAWSLPVATAMISIVIICFLIFRIVPKEQRATFFFAGLLAELSVLYFWIFLLGPKLMP